MAFLDDLKKKMSTPGADRYSEERFQAAKPQVVEQEAASQTTDVSAPVLLNIEEESRKKRKKIYMSIGILAAVIIVAALTFAGIALFRAMFLVDQKSIDIQIKAPNSVPSGDNAEFSVTVKNKSRVVWENVLLNIDAPEGLSVALTEPKVDGENNVFRWGVGTLRPNESSTVSIKGRLVGVANSKANVGYGVALTPSNSKDKKIQKKDFLAVHVDESPVQINIIAPKQTASGERMQVKVIYQNKKSEDVTGVRILVVPPQGFSLEQANPPVSGSQLVWDFPVLAQQSQGEITFHGSISGEPEVVRAFKATLGFITPENKFLFQNDVQATTAIARRAITITQILNNNQDTLKVNPSDKVEAKVLVKNSGDIGLRDVIVKTKFSGIGLNPALFESQGGFYDSRLNTITWTASSVPVLKALRPGDTAEMAFKFSILGTTALPFANEKDKNFSVTAQTTADSPDIPTPVGGEKVISSGKFVMMLNTVLQVNKGAFYDDGRAGLPVGVGPLPPRVGQETIYTIQVRIKNSANDVVDGLYRAVLPEGLRWVGNKYTTTGSVTFDERTREIKWTLPIIPGRSGTGTPAPEFAFQVGLTPSLNQIGSRPVLCLGSSMDGTDTYTGARLHATAEAVTTEDANPEKSEVMR